MEFGGTSSGPAAAAPAGDRLGVGGGHGAAAAAARHHDAGVVAEAVQAVVEGGGRRGRGRRRGAAFISGRFIGMVRGGDREKSIKRPIDGGSQ